MEITNNEKSANKSVSNAVSELFGENVRITGKNPVYGGDINQSFRLSLSDGSFLFMKCNTSENFDFFKTEVTGLEALRAAGSIGVPKPLAAGIDKAVGASYLIMEYLESAAKGPYYWENFGRNLAMLHQSELSAAELGNNRGANSNSTNLRFGFCEDNFIGATKQINTPKETWVEFFRDCRLAPQMKMAEKYMSSGMKRQCAHLLEHLASYMPEPDFPSLIHGDLWSGNAYTGPDGEAWILDPAAYVGCFEAELAMTELFGGFPGTFYQAYNEITKIDPEYHGRRDLYNLYHLLNHLNLFGSSYLGSVQRILQAY